MDHLELKRLHLFFKNATYIIILHQWELYQDDTLVLIFYRPFLNHFILLFYLLLKYHNNIFYLQIPLFYKIHFLLSNKLKIKIDHKLIN